MNIDGLMPPNLVNMTATIRDFSAYGVFAQHKQITLLIALTARVFDTVPLGRMKAAEQAVQQAASRVPAELRQRILDGRPLALEDRKAILALATAGLVSFREKTDE